MTPRHGRGRRAGFTLIEIMVALVISAMLVGLTLSIFSRMSLAFRTQQNVGELQQVLTAAQDLIAREVRQAGFGMPDGFFVGGNELLQSPVQVVNDADGFGPDELRVYYADASAQARVIPPLGELVVNVDDADDFRAGDVAVISGYDGGYLGTKKVTACVVQIEAIAGSQLTLDGAGAYGTADNRQCAGIRAAPTTGKYTIMIYRLRARAFRIDPTRRALAVLQVSPSGALIEDDWQDLGLGFTDLQLASRWYEAANTVDEDGDGDPTREWYSSEQQETLSYGDHALGADAPFRLASYDPLQHGQPAYPRMTELRVSLAVRTHNKIDTVPSRQTPRFTDPARPTTNPIGDRDAVVLDGVPDASRPEELRGEHVYRYATVGTDLRNLGLGQ
ncbi:MAG TPA: prepilin-type N-terminal cleavage/methylation domain-containing protein [Kofleriaceae bacterium]|nr:prepilin-type N-terminal cleavage/methylation domain-containing protein [Kofleriaceae bacterium]